MTEAYQEPGVNVETILENLAADSRAARLPTAIIGECYQVVSKENEGKYSGTSSSFSYKGLITGAVVEQTTVKTYILIDGSEYEVTTITGVNEGAANVSLPANLRYTVQEEKTDGTVSGTIWTSASGEFIEDGVKAGDLVVTGSNTAEIVAVLGSTRLQLAGPSPSVTAGAYTIQRPMGSATKMGDVLISYRAARTDDDIIGEYVQASSVTDLRNIFGKDAVGTHLNPLGFAMSLALSAGGATVGGYGINANNISQQSEYQSGVESMSRRRIYNIVPLTLDTTYQDVVIEHVKNSSEFDNRERRAYVTRTMSETGTKDQQAEAAASIARGLNSERVTLVGPDKITISSGGSSTEVDSFYLAAIKAGQRTGSSIGQPLIRSNVPFVTNVNKGSEYFTRAQLNTMAGAGWQMFVRDAIGAPVYCRDELTTRQGLGPKYGQESEVVARDHAAYLFRDSLDQLIGGFNVTPQTISTLQLSASAVISNLLSERFQPFTTIELISVIESTDNPGRVEISVRMTQSDPLTGVDVTIIV